MTEPQKNVTTARCACGKVAIEATGAPIATAACHCDDCQEGARQIEARSGAIPVREPDGGTAYVLYRKDRVEIAKGAELLQGFKIREQSATNRVIATCCNSAMFLGFDRGPHWVSVYRARIQGDVPPLQMHVCRKPGPESKDVAGDVSSYPGFPFKLGIKLVGSRIAMLFGR